jgi:hypothetical protein
LEQELNNTQVEYITQLETLKKNYCEVFAGNSGKFVLEDLSKYCFARKTTFSKEALEMAFREGQRSILLHIQNIQEIDIEKTQQLLKKQQVESER